MTKIDLSAKQIEYSMTEDVLDKFVNFLTFIDTCSCKETKMDKSYKYFSNHKKMPDKCSNCINNKKIILIIHTAAVNAVNNNLFCFW